MSVTPEERKEIEDQLIKNGYATVDDIPFTVKQLALLNFHNLRKLQATLEGQAALYVPITAFESYKRAVQTTVTAIVSAAVGISAVVAMIALS